MAFYLCLLAQNAAAIVSTAQVELPNGTLSPLAARLYARSLSPNAPPPARAQVLDSLLATFVLGKSYALELYPRPLHLLAWSSADCSAGALGSGACVPFSYQGLGGAQGDDFDDDASVVRGV